MKAFFITTQTNETFKHYESFASLPGNEIGLYMYQNRKATGALVSGEKLDSEIYEAAKAYAPDLIVYVGAAGGNIPSKESFARLKNEVAPTVHFCSDAADDPWWPYLADYDNAGSFAAQVALDGNKHWPLAATQLTALTTLDMAHFRDWGIPHSKRPVVFGFAGNFSATWKREKDIPVRREELIEQMTKFGLQHRKRDSRKDSYQEYADYLCRCRIVVNFARTGSGRFMHVKGRVVEAGFAGAALLEQRGAPTSDWFTPGVDYLEYESADEARGIVESLRNRPEETQAFGARLRAKVLAEHGSDKFWARIFERIGLAVPA